MTKEKRNNGRGRKTIAYWTERMKECANYGVEEGHMKGDDILCEILKLTGYGDVVKEFEKLDKWYA